MALLAYVLLRYHSYLSEWSHSFSRLCTRAIKSQGLSTSKLRPIFGFIPER